MPKKQTSDMTSKSYHLTKLACLIVRQLCGCKTKEVDRLISEFSQVEASQLITPFSLVYVVGYQPANPKPRELRTYADYGVYDWHFTGLIVDDEEVNFKINFGSCSDVLKVEKDVDGIDNYLNQSIDYDKRLTKSSILSANFVAFVCSKVGKPIPKIGQRDDYGNRILIYPYIWRDWNSSTPGDLNESRYWDLGDDLIYPSDETDHDPNHIIKDSNGHYIRWATMHRNSWDKIQGSCWRTRYAEFTPDKIFLWFQETNSTKIKSLEKAYQIIFKEVSHNVGTKCE